MPEGGGGDGGVEVLGSCCAGGRDGDGDVGVLCIGGSSCSGSGTSESTEGPPGFGEWHSPQGAHRFRGSSSLLASVLVVSAEERSGKPKSRSFASCPRKRLTVLCEPGPPRMNQLEQEDVMNRASRSELMMAAYWICG